MRFQTEKPHSVRSITCVENHLYSSTWCGHTHRQNHCGEMWLQREKGLIKSCCSVRAEWSPLIKPLFCLNSNNTQSHSHAQLPTHAHMHIYPVTLTCTSTQWKEPTPSVWQMKMSMKPNKRFSLLLSSIHSQWVSCCFEPSQLQRIY